jgi:hypothetical protein
MLYPIFQSHVLRFSFSRITRIITYSFRACCSQTGNSLQIPGGRQTMATTEQQVTPRTRCTAEGALDLSQWREPGHRVCCKHPKPLLGQQNTGGSSIEFTRPALVSSPGQTVPQQSCCHNTRDPRLPFHAHPDAHRRCGRGCVARVCRACSRRRGPRRCGSDLVRRLPAPPVPSHTAGVVTALNPDTSPA